jgi:hypothetical protein
MLGCMAKLAERSVQGREYTYQLEVHHIMQPRALVQYLGHVPYSCVHKGGSYAV